MFGVQCSLTALATYPTKLAMIYSSLAEIESISSAIDATLLSRRCSISGVWLVWVSLTALDTLLCEVMVVSFVLGLKCIDLLRKQCKDVEEILHFPGWAGSTGNAINFEALI